MEIKFLPQPDGRNGVTAIFQKDGKYYCADLNSVPVYGSDSPFRYNECMIFHANKRGKITNWLEVYCNRKNDSISEENLIRCIEEFCAE